MRTYGKVVITVGLLMLGLGAIDIAPAAAGGGGCHRDMQFGPTEATGTRVELVAACMTPSVLRVEPGSVVTFVNNDEFSHNLYGSGMFVHDLATGAEAAYRFDDAGTFAYACTIHPGMVGAIVVGEGRRTAAGNTTILPVEVQPASVQTQAAPTTLAPVPLAATSAAADTSGDDFPFVPAAVALATVAAIAYLAGRRRVSES